MTIFSTPRLQREDMDASEFGTGLGPSLGASAVEAFEENPTTQLFGMREINEAQARDRGEDMGSALERVYAGEDPADVMYGPPVRKRPEMLPLEARERVKEAGLDKQLTIPDGAMIEPSALDIMMERARHRQERAATIARGPQGVVPTALSVGTSFLVGAADPINIASAFIPVVGEMRYAKMLEAAGESAIARAGVRAQVGAASGAVGMAAIEPIAAFAKTQEGQDYTMAMALRSVIFGAALGGALHTGGGAIADVLRTRGERPLYPFGEGEPMEFHTPFEELRQPPTGAAIPLPGDEFRAPVRLPETFEEAARRADNIPEEPLGPSPTIAMIDDLPPRAREDAMRAATAALIEGRPVQSGDIIAAAAREDPRIAESVAEGNAHAIATAAELSPHGRVVFDDMRTQLKAAGMSPEESAANAAIVAARYEARAARLEGAGGTAEDLYRAEGIRVQRGGVEDEMGRMFAQSGQRHFDFTNPGGGTRDVKIGPTEITYGVGKNGVELTLIKTPRDERGQGYARAALRQMTREADEAGVRIMLNADPMDRGIRKSGLVDFYKSLGFERNAGRTRDFSTRAEYIREPRTPRELFQRRRPGLEGQQDMFGGARATDADMAQRGADAPLRPDVAQKPMDEGLFGDTAAQADLVDQARQKGQRELFQPPTVPTFFSAVSRAISSARQEKASPDQWLATLRNTPGVKQEELQWLGLPDWLKEQKGSVSRKDIEGYVRANNIEVREVQKGLTNRNGPLEAERQNLEAEQVDLIDRHREAQEGSFYEGAEEPKWMADLSRRLGDVTKRLEQINNELETAGAPPKFASYTLPGGENYRELLLTLPPKADREGAPLPRHEGDPNDLDNLVLRPGEPTVIRTPQYVSSHFDEPNILSHIRFNDRTIDGKKTLFIEEIQSDWHQAGKRKGYRQEMPAQERAALVAESEALQQKQRQMLGAGQDYSDRATRQWNPEYLAVQDRIGAIRERLSGGEGVPDAPFKTTWPELAFKRMIRYAAENGYEKIAWTPGEVQAARYDLSTQLHSLDAFRNPDGTYDLGGIGRTEPNARAEGRQLGSNIPEAKLEDYVGKEMAKKIIEQGEQWKRYEGLDLKVGGEGMKGFYDKILPATVNKLVKKYGAKVEDGEIAYGGNEYGNKYGWEKGDDGRFYITTPDGRTGQSFATRQEAQTAMTGLMQPDTKHTVHAIDLTEPLRKAATEEGFPLFQREPGGEMRGRITLADNKAIIDLFRSSDRSTFMHETGHLWLDELARDAARANAPEGIRQDMETVLKWLGAERADAITTEQHEKWARGFETYLSTGDAPTEGLRAVFRQFKEWLAAIYRGIVGAGEPISDDIRRVMDRMIATPAQIEREAADVAATVHMGPRPARGPASRDPETFTLYEFLAARGGLRPDPELHAMFGGANPFIPGFGKLIRKGGMGLDRAREAAVEAGYLRDAPAAEAQAAGTMQARPSESTERNLLDAIDRQARGEKVYREGREPSRKQDFDPDEELFRLHQAIDDTVREIGMDPVTLPEPLRARILQIMTREGERDPEIAYERAVMEESHNGAETGRNERIQDHIPGWDQVHDVGAPAQAPGGPAAGLGGPAGAGPGAAPRRAGGNDRQAAGRADAGPSPADAWNRIADTPRDYNEPDVIAASRRADELPEPASAKPDKRLAAAQKAEADSKLAYDAAAEYLPADLRGDVEQKLRLIDQESLDTAEVVRRGAACLAAGVVGGGDMSEKPQKPWGPFGMGPWKGHPKVYCGVCGWPQYHMWVDREHEPPGDCPEGHTIARACPLVCDTLMRNAWLREAMGGKPPQPPVEMLRAVAGFTWPEIEQMCDANGNASHTIAEMRARRSQQQAT